MILPGQETARVRAERAAEASLGERAEALVAALRDELTPEALQAGRPISTYRLQLSPGFGFDQAAAVVPYLEALGVTHLYLSPILSAVPGSTHGYDVVDHNTLSDQLGGEAGFEALSAAVQSRKMGLLLDFVPNHMAVGPWNRWWMDLLENGPSSQCAAYFDVDWQPVKQELENKVLLPVLGDQFGVVLERGELVLAREGGTFFIRYHEHRFPIAPRAMPLILRHGLEGLQQELGAEGQQDLRFQELLSIITQLENLPHRTETDPSRMTERAREKEVAKRRLGVLCEESPRIRDFIDRNVALFNGRPGEPRSFDLLERLLASQAYRLAHWRVAGEEINYRRFFDINGLAALRMEDPQVLGEAHRLTLRLVREGKVSGLRIDHPDGLYAPAGYFRYLQHAYLLERCRSLAEARGGALDAELEPVVDARLGEAVAAGELPVRPLYLVAEKILLRNERMPDAWPIDGATGYDFLAGSTGLFVDGRNAAAFDALYTRFVGTRIDFATVCLEKKRLITSSSMASEINMLAHRLNRLSETNRRTRDFTLNDLTRALVEFVAHFPIYRTYLEGPDAADIDAHDRHYIELALSRARRQTPLTNASVYDFLRDVLLLRYPSELSDAERHEWLEFTLKLQQVTGPVTAKAIEDTAFYVYNRLVALNEVGGDPREFGTSPATFHERCLARQRRWRGSLNATSTHDTKRSEDVRLRIAALSEVPGEWRERLARWSRLNLRLKTDVEGTPAPDRNDELLLYQTLVGVWPEGAEQADDALVERVAAYLEKAIREAKVHTSWTAPHADYEAATRRFVEAVMRSGRFLKELLPFQARIAAAGRLSSLAQTALKCFAPGIPDVYQGCELWDLSLVDPDNRRPVDFAARARMLAEIEGGLSNRLGLAREVASPAAIPDGRAKMLLLREGLRFRRERPELFWSGEHLPLEVEGPMADRVLAFARHLKKDRSEQAAICVVPRLVLGAMAADGRLALEGAVRIPNDLPTSYRDLVTGERRQTRGGTLDLRPLLEDFPVAILGDA
jgi:(1->4)-alpha-D-glucan 1-alpha-D-glucosylmutase